MMATKRNKTIKREIIKRVKRIYMLAVTRMRITSVCDYLFIICLLVAMVEHAF